MRLASVEVDALLGDRLSWRERRAGGPAWLTSELVCSPAAREKLTAWLDATPPPWEPPSAEAVLEAVQFGGDWGMLGAVIDVLEAIAPPASAYVLRSCNILAPGRKTWGWAGPMPEPRPWQIVISGGEDGTADTARRVLAHEASHVWTLPEPTGPGSMPTLHELALATTTNATPLTPERRAAFEQHRAQHGRYERWAETLAASWGFPLDLEGEGCP